MEIWKRILLRAAGFGAGCALFGAITIGCVIWWTGRPPKPKPWSDTAITASYSAITLQERGEEVDVVFEYALTNHTALAYSLPTPSSGALMRRIPKEHSFDRLEGASWDDTLVIPPGQSFNLKFTVVYKLGDYDTTNAELNTLEPGENRKEAPSRLNKFMNRRLDEIDGLEFFDYLNHYQIDLSRKWDLHDSKT